MTTLASNLIRQTRRLLASRAAAVLFATLFCFMALPLHATVSTVAYWRMGEHDVPSLFGLAGTLTDETGNFPLAVAGQVEYSTDVSATASNDLGSTVSAYFLGGAFATNNIVSTATNDFGIECWVKPVEATNEQIIAYNGHASFSGWGLMIHQTNYCGILGGVAFVGAVPVVTNVWTHLALVCEFGITTLFVNGVPVASTSLSPNMPATEFALGAAPQVNSAFFDGSLDEVRVFTF